VKTPLQGDPPACRLVCGELEALFLPNFGMLGASLRQLGDELLRRIDDLDLVRAQGSTAGIPLLHPWANRLAGFHYSAAGRDVDLHSSSPLLHLDANGLPIHGVPWSMLAWTVTSATATELMARLEWTRGDLLSIFPFPHWLEMSALLAADSLTLKTTLIAGSAGPVPVSFGFHPYFGLPGIPRDEWRVHFPAMRRLTLDACGIPTGSEESFAALDTTLEGLDFDDGFCAPDEQVTLSLSGGGRHISLEFLQGYPYAQIYAPKDRPFIALEPMTAPTNALMSGRGLRLVEPGAKFSASFRIRVTSN